MRGGGEGGFCSSAFAMATISRDKKKAETLRGFMETPRASSDSDYTAVRRPRRGRLEG